MRFREVENELSTSPPAVQELNFNFFFFFAYGDIAAGIQNYTADAALMVNICDCQPQESKITLSGRDICL